MGSSRHNWMHQSPKSHSRLRPLNKNKIALIFNTATNFYIFYYLKWINLCKGLILQLQIFYFSCEFNFGYDNVWCILCENLYFIIIIHISYHCLYTLAFINKKSPHIALLSFVICKEEKNIFSFFRYFFWYSAQIKFWK